MAVLSEFGWIDDEAEARGSAAQPAVERDTVPAT
jgi:hypothetical protein